MRNLLDGEVGNSESIYAMSLHADLTGAGYI